jgi:hypothetical protein
MAARARGRGYDDAPAKPKPRSDVYTGLLILSLLAQIAGSVFLYLDWSEYKTDKPPQVSSIQPVGGGPAVPPGPAPGPGGPPARPGAPPAPPRGGAPPAPPGGGAPK